MVRESPSPKEMLQRQRESQDTQAGSMYGHQKRGAVDAQPAPRRMSREERSEYEGELEYAYQREQSAADAEYRDAMNAQYDALPDRRTTPTGRERVASAVDRARGVGAGIVDAFRRQDEPRRDQQPQRGRAPAPRGPARGSAPDPFIRQIASGSGFGGLGSQQRSANTPPPTRAASVVITTCDEYGNCKTKKISGGGESRPRQRRRPPGFAGILGGDDPGFF